VQFRGGEDEDEETFEDCEEDLRRILGGQPDAADAVLFK